MYDYDWYTNLILSTKYYSMVKLKGTTPNAYVSLKKYVIFECLKTTKKL